MAGEVYTRELPSPNDGLALGGETSGPPENSASPANLLIALRHHWKLVVGVWLLTTALAVPPVWLFVKPEYTATSMIKVDPILSSVLDQQDKTMPLFDSFLASQVQAINSSEVLNRAIDDPKVLQLPQAKDPVVFLDTVRENLSVNQIPKTMLIKVDVTDRDSRVATVMADAIVDAYTALRNFDREIDKKLEFLDKEKKHLAENLEYLKTEKTRAAEEYKASTDSMFELLREVKLKRTQQLEDAIGAKDLEILQLNEEKARVEAGKDLPPEESDPIRLSQAIDSDPLVRSLQQQLQEQSERVVQLRASMSKEATPLQEAEANLQSLKAELEAERIKATNEYIDRQKQRMESLKSRRIEDLEARILSAENTRINLVKSLQERTDEDQLMGATNLQINELQDRMEAVRKDLAEIEEAQKRLRLQKEQPGTGGRISKYTPAEILPSGKKDKRIKLVGAAVAGCMFAALGVGLLRGRFDLCVYIPTQVETQTGLRILGVVPAIAELKRGRIAQEDFAEAYRLVRVNILSPALGNPPKSILVTSAHASEGKTSLAVSLAVSLAELGGRVLLVDADTQAPQIGRLLSLDGPGRLRHVLSGEKEVSKAAVISRLPNLDVLLGCANGDAVPRSLIDHNTVGRLVQSAVNKYDFVVIDSPPALGTADSIIWSQAVDSVVVSALVGYSDVGSTRHLCDRLAMAGARVLGAVVCNVSLRSGSAYSSYSTSRSRSTASDEQRPICMLPQTKGTQDPASS